MDFKVELIAFFQEIAIPMLIKDSGEEEFIKYINRTHVISIEPKSLN